MLSSVSRVVAFFLICCSACVAAQVQVSVSSTSGAPVKDCLVIVQDLQPQERELYRALTDEQGRIPAHDLSAGLYRAIAVYPYSHWQTNVSEFLVHDAPVEVPVRLQQSDGLDEIDVSDGQLTVDVLDADGRPAVGARVLVRDFKADPRSEHWGTTDAQGKTTLDLTLNPAALIVVYHDRLYTFATSGLERERTLRLK